MAKHYLFVDESGDPGYKIERGSSKYFILVGVLVKTINELDNLTRNIKDIRMTLSLPADYEFKFGKTNTKVKQSFIDKVLKTSGYSILICVVDKKGRQMATDYGDVLQKMLIVLPVCKVRLVIDGEMSKIHKLKISADIRKRLKGEKCALDSLTFRNSRSDGLIQLADMLAGTYNRILQNDRDFVGFKAKVDKKLYANPILL